VHDVRLTFLSENETDAEIPVPTLNPNSSVAGSSLGPCNRTYNRQLLEKLKFRAFMTHDYTNT